MKTRNLLVSVLMFVSVLLSACAPAATSSPVPTAIPPTAVRPTTVPSNQTTFHSSENASFRLPLSFTYGPEWEVGSGAPGAIDIMYKNQWGPSIFLVTGAQVADPKDTTKLIAWPDDFFAYFASLPGVEVLQGPDPVTIGGVSGEQVIVKLSSSFPPFLWLKGDYTWIGRADWETKWQMILLDVNGERVLLRTPDSPEKFDEHYPLVQEIFNSITFGK